MFTCPLSNACRRAFATDQARRRHWLRTHQAVWGRLDMHLQQQLHHEQQRTLPVEEVCEMCVGEAEGDGYDVDVTDEERQHVLQVAMSHIDSMKFRYYETDAEIERAKQFAGSVVQALKPMLVAALQPHVRNGVDVLSLIDPILSVVDGINSRRREATMRKGFVSSQFPPLRVYPRKLGDLPACQLLNRRKRALPSEAFAYDTRLEELMEREMVADPTLITEIILAHEHWLKRSKEIRHAGWRSASRSFRDVCDGQAWQEHPFLGDPDYTGPVRLAFEGYCDDIDIPNPIGTAAGHHKLWLSFLVLLNRPARSRMTLRSIHLATVCLAKDFKTFGPRAVISDPHGDDETSNSIGATMRRLHRGVVLKTPPSTGLQGLEVRGWMPLWTADGLAQGEVYGTNSSFSAAKNICNRCEDMDQHDRKKREPCGFLRCTCGPNAHDVGCKCHFKVRTAAGDAAWEQPLSKQRMQALGITTMEHGFKDVPHFDVARPGPKEPMHAFAEGRTKHLAAYTLWNIVASGFATVDEVRAAAHNFDWTAGGGSAGFFNPTYLPDKLFTSTRVEQEDGSSVWGPHSDSCKLPFSAAGIITFTAMSLPFFKKLIPRDKPYPKWFRAWVLHANAVMMMLRYSFTYAELLNLEWLIVESESLISVVPEYRHVWVAKAHWVLHLAQDIFDWGPARLLWVMLKEMKNAHFKRGCKRSNFHNPVKSTAEFWALQSDYEAMELLRNPDRRSAVDSTSSAVLVSGQLSGFTESQVCQLLVQHAAVEPTACVDFLQSLTFQGVTVARGEHLFYDGLQLFRVERVVRCCNFHYLWLELIPAQIAADEMGIMYLSAAELQEANDSPTINRLVCLTNATDITFLWTIHDPPVYQFVVKF